MKRLPTILFTLLTVSSVAAQAATIEETFRQGVEQYRSASSPEDYARAADLFRELNDTFRIKAPEVLLNLGAAEYLSSGTDDGTDRTGEAMLFLHRASAAAPDSLAAGLARRNLETIRHRLNERSSGRDEPGYVFAPYNDGWTALFSWLPADPASSVFLAFWAALFLVLAVRRLFPRRLSVILPAVLALLTAITGVAAYGASRVNDYKTGVVLEKAPLYEEFLSMEPDDELPEGLEFRLLEHKDRRLLVRLSSGQTGWVPEDRVGIP